MHRIGRKRKGPDADDDDPSQNNLRTGENHTVDLLSDLNEQVERAWAARHDKRNEVPNPDCIPQSIWFQWLWMEDPLQEAHIDLLLNRMQLIGLLIARYIFLCMKLINKGSNIDLDAQVQGSLPEQIQLQ